MSVVKSLDPSWLLSAKGVGFGRCHPFRGGARLETHWAFPFDFDVGVIRKRRVWPGEGLCFYAPFAF